MTEMEIELLAAGVAVKRLGSEVAIILGEGIDCAFNALNAAKAYAALSLFGGSFTFQPVRPVGAPPIEVVHEHEKLTATQGSQKIELPGVLGRAIVRRLGGIAKSVEADTRRSA
jgi:hypothetical protein